MLDDGQWEGADVLLPGIICSSNGARSFGVLGSMVASDWVPRSRPFTQSPRYLKFLCGVIIDQPCTVSSQATGCIVMAAQPAIAPTKLLQRQHRPLRQPRQAMQSLN